MFVLQVTRNRRLDELNANCLRNVKRLRIECDFSACEGLYLPSINPRHAIFANLIHLQVLIYLEIPMLCENMQENVMIDSWCRDSRRLEYKREEIQRVQRCEYLGTIFFYNLFDPAIATVLKI